jgi:hypothetical protein
MQIIGDVGKQVRRRLSTSKLRTLLVWLRHRGLEPNDVFLASHMRSGNTWLRFILCEVLTQDAADFQNVKFVIPDIRSRQEGSRVLPSGGRLIKTHECYRSEYKKAIYIARDPRDVAVSLHRFERPDQNLDDFIKAFVQGRTTSHGSWHKHVKSWLVSPLRQNGNLLFLKYETLFANPEGTVATVMDFLGVCVDTATIQAAVANNDLRAMRAKEDRARGLGMGITGEKIRSKGRRIREGSIGGWRKTLTPSQARLIEEHAGDLLVALGYTFESSSNFEELDPRTNLRVSMGSSKTEDLRAVQLRDLSSAD